MIKRLTWFVSGVIAGATAFGMARRKVRTVAEDLTPAKVAARARDRVRDAIDEGRRAMRAKEAELRARTDGRATTLADHVDPLDEVLVDGRPVEPGQVIVLRQVRDTGERPRRRRA
jgi:hypothetical protein